MLVVVLGLPVDTMLPTLLIVLGCRFRTFPPDGPEPEPGPDELPAVVAALENEGARIVAEETRAEFTFLSENINRE